MVQKITQTQLHDIGYNVGCIMGMLKPTMPVQLAFYRIKLWLVTQDLDDTQLIEIEEAFYTGFLQWKAKGLTRTYEVLGARLADMHTNLVWYTTRKDRHASIKRFLDYLNVPNWTQFETNILTSFDKECILLFETRKAIEKAKAEEIADKHWQRQRALQALKDESRCYLRSRQISDYSNLM